MHEGMKTEQKNLLTGSLAAAACEFFYGLSYVFTKHATDGATPLALLGWRFLIALATMSVLVLLRVIKLDFRGKPLIPLFLTVLFSPCLYYISEAYGIKLTTASESGAFLACIPAFSLAASSLILRKKPSRHQLTGILITFVGVFATVAALGMSSSLSVPGYLFLLTAVISYSLYSVFAEKASAFSSAELTFAMLISGALLFIPASIAEAYMEGSILNLIKLPYAKPDFLIAALYQGTGCSVIAFLLNNYAISRIGVNRTSSFVGLSTAVSIIAGALILNEDFNIYQIAGVVLIICGVYYANSAKRRRT